METQNNITSTYIGGVSGYITADELLRKYENNRYMDFSGYETIYELLREIDSTLLPDTAYVENKEIITNSVIDTDAIHVNKIFDVKTCRFVRGKIYIGSCEFINGEIQFPKEKLTKTCEFDILPPRIIDIKYCNFIGDEDKDK